MACRRNFNEDKETHDFKLEGEVVMHSILMQLSALERFQVMECIFRLMTITVAIGSRASS